MFSGISQFILKIYENCEELHIVVGIYSICWHSQNKIIIYETEHDISLIFASHKPNIASCSPEVHSIVNLVRVREYFHCWEVSISSISCFSEAYIYRNFSDYSYIFLLLWNFMFAVDTTVVFFSPLPPGRSTYVHCYKYKHIKRLMRYE